MHPTSIILWRGWVLLFWSTVWMTTNNNMVVQSQQSSPEDDDDAADLAVTGAFFFGPLCWFSADRCGFLGLFQGMHRMDPVTGQCQDICVWLPFLHPDYQCGYCPIDNDSFTIDLNLTGVPDPDHLFFTQAKQYWESVIVSDRPEVRLDGWTGFLLRLIAPELVGCPLPDRVDDLFICARYGRIDGIYGSSNVYAQSAPLLTPDGKFSGFGFMVLDGSDMIHLKQQDTQDLRDLILHEMAHVLGFGTFTLFDLAEVAEDTDDEDDEGCIYRGAKANAEYQALSGCNNATVPMSSSCAHFSEDCFPTELMSRRVDSPGKDPISRLTLAALEDLGYTINYDAAGNYSRAEIDEDCTCTNGGRTKRRKKNRLALESHAESGKKHRRISEETYQYAVDHGLNFLAQQRRRTRSVLSSVNIRMDLLIAPMLHVLVKDEDGFHSVIVKVPPD